MKYNLYFLQNQDVEYFIGKYRSMRKIDKAITEFLDAHNYETHYSDINIVNENEFIIDVGNLLGVFKLTIDS